MTKKLLWFCAIAWLCMACGTNSTTKSDIFTTFYQANDEGNRVRFVPSDDSTKVRVYFMYDGKVSGQAEWAMWKDSTEAGTVYVGNEKGVWRIHDGQIDIFSEGTDEVSSAYFLKGKTIPDHMIEAYRNELVANYYQKIEEEKKRQEEERQRIEKHPIEVKFSDIRFVKRYGYTGLVIKAKLRNLSDKTFVGIEFWEEYGFNEYLQTYATVEFNKEYRLNQMRKWNEDLPKVSYKHPWKPQETREFEAYLCNPDLASGAVAYMPQFAILNLRFRVDELNGVSRTIEEQYDLINLWEEFMEQYEND